MCDVKKCSQKVWDQSWKSSRSGPSGRTKAKQRGAPAQLCPRDQRPADRKETAETVKPPPSPSPHLFLHPSFPPCSSSCQTYFQSPGKSVDSSLFPLLGLLAGYPFQQTWWSEYSGKNTATHSDVIQNILKVRWRVHSTFRHSNRGGFIYLQWFSSSLESTVEMWMTLDSPSLPCINIHLLINRWKIQSCYRTSRNPTKTNLIPLNVLLSMYLIWLFYLNEFILWRATCFFIIKCSTAGVCVCACVCPGQ